MNALPLRVRITALVVIAATAIVALVFGLGGVSSVEDSIAVETFESSSDALAEANGSLLNYGDGLKDRIRIWSEERASDPFDRWEESEGINVMVLDQDGRPTTLILGEQVSISKTFQCRATSGTIVCVGGGDAANQVPEWGRLAVEERAEFIGEGVPGVVHGFLVESASGEPHLVRLETDIFAATDVDVSSGFEELAVVLLVLLLLALGAITWFSLGRALSPVGSMIAQVDQIGAESLHQRVPVPAAKDELQRLATTMNRMLDRLQRSSESQRQFISDASHELRSPITATGATLEVARANPDTADWQQVASVVEEENDRLAALVDDLLILARLDEDRTQPLTDVIDLEELCLAEAERTHPVDVSVRVVAPARITGNLATVTRAIRNLVDNAAAHASSSVQIEVDGSGTSTSDNSAVGRFAVVRINDDGPGIPPDQSERIFERFVRIDESRNRADGGGAGLGLAIARGIAETHAGTVSLDSTSSSGSSFSLRLPL